ncbi:helicase-related protein [Actinoallomurus sp. CA-142502]|uniref:helicase-related protein n=1 Tax=Actinoallomurus sp. CA-142502 TaxID=3239885 RepID=UPI003D92CF65
MTGHDPTIERRQARREASRRRRDLEREAAARARVRLAARTTPPERVVLHLGPTNSGKTHDAIEFLVAQAVRGRSGTYAAPLRMLAREVYERLRARLPHERVGLVTGEERINPRADVVSCTAESAPTGGDVLVLDEAHWLADPDRGHAWTRLLLSGSHRHIHVAAAPEAGAVLRTALAQAGHLEIARHSRQAELTHAPPMSPGTVPAGSAVLAFSRRAVLALHRELIDHGRRATVLYGAMPPGARREQIQRLVAGEVEVIVTTDVIGHGINLPLRAVAFAETGKFDGTKRRPLRLWEAAQMAGRAGRRGLADAEGRVAVYAGGIPGFAPDAGLVRAAVAVANGAPSDLSIDRAHLRPDWCELGDPAPAEIPHALTGWRKAARHAVGARPWLRPAPIDPLLSMWQAARAAVRARATVDASWPGDGATVWRLMTLPVDAGGAFPAIASAVLTDGSLRGMLRPESAVARMSLDEAERHAAMMRDLGAAGRSFGVVGGVHPEEASAGEEAASRRVVELVARRRPLTDASLCASCGRPCAPWFQRCDDCHRAALDWYDDGPPAW